MREPPSGTGTGPGRRATAPSLRRLGAPLGVAAGLGAAAVLVRTVDPNEPGHYPVCPLLRHTGLLCPACGGLRGLHALLRGDLPAALHANAPAVLGYAVFAVLWAVWCVRAVRHDGGLPLALRPAHWCGIGLLVLVFTVVRNLPCGALLAP
ncbi:DUF2752 domain-containing protein [Streptomyces huiliensis]|uniref:DUF2752 domain-containing protein n=1 Tax=Streptomyces huiliensis TaxID=2876027 RepID=UPI001CBDE695|nr:DUF2752 domain-containing protein [Streptomyces huiliensis]MBZ4318866.1 DUF2752 domain-containing protein [Streptomyces huiliensis]